ncbi:MAG: SRPBCC family protein [Chloroflexota bacterium]|nr:MAG: SRPBCC family protein [Chloroflexota bacterium]
MDTVKKSIEVDVPVSTAYNQWTQFEEFPKFMKGVEEVRQLSDRRLHWRAEFAGVKREWDAEIIEQMPDKRIAWRSTSGPTNNGLVMFESIDGDRCRVTMEVQYDPQGLLENVADKLGFLSRHVETELKDFKEFIESRGKETGAWRGQIFEKEQPPEHYAGE